MVVDKRDGGKTQKVVLQGRGGIPEKLGASYHQEVWRSIDGAPTNHWLVIDTRDRSVGIAPVSLQTEGIIMV